MESTNTIYYIRTLMLKIMHEYGENLDREVYDTKQRTSIKAEIKEIAEMIRDKDNYMKTYENLDTIRKDERMPIDQLTKETRDNMIKLLHNERNKIVATQYSSKELKVVDQELKDVEKLIKEKDRVLLKTRPTGLSHVSRIRKDHFAKYFDIER